MEELCDFLFQPAEIANMNNINFPLSHGKINPWQSGNAAVTGQSSEQVVNRPDWPEGVSAIPARGLATARRLWSDFASSQASGSVSPPEGVSQKRCPDAVPVSGAMPHEGCNSPQMRANVTAVWLAQNNSDFNFPSLEYVSQADITAILNAANWFNDMRQKLEASFGPGSVLAQPATLHWHAIPGSELKQGLALPPDRLTLVSSERTYLLPGLKQTDRMAENASETNLAAMSSGALNAGTARLLYLPADSGDAASDDVHPIEQFTNAQALIFARPGIDTGRPVAGHGSGNDLLAACERDDGLRGAVLDFLRRLAQFNRESGQGLDLSTPGVQFHQTPEGNYLCRIKSEAIAPPSSPVDFPQAAAFLVKARQSRDNGTFDNFKPSVEQARQFLRAAASLAHANVFRLALGEEEDWVNLADFDDRLANLNPGDDLLCQVLRKLDTMNLGDGTREMAAGAWMLSPQSLESRSSDSPFPPPDARLQPYTRFPTIPLAELAASATTMYGVLPATDTRKETHYLANTLPVAHESESSTAAMIVQILGSNQQARLSIKASQPGGALDTVVLHKVVAHPRIEKVSATQMVSIALAALSQAGHGNAVRNLCVAGFDGEEALQSEVAAVLSEKNIAFENVAFRKIEDFDTPGHEGGHDGYFERAIAFALPDGISEASTSSQEGIRNFSSDERALLCRLEATAQAERAAGRALNPSSVRATAARALYEQPALAGIVQLWLRQTLEAHYADGANSRGIKGPAVRQLAMRDERSMFVYFFAASLERKYQEVVANVEAGDGPWMDEIKNAVERLREKGIEPRGGRGRLFDPRTNMDLLFNVLEEITPALNRATLAQIPEDALAEVGKVFQRTTREFKASSAAAVMAGRKPGVTDQDLERLFAAPFSDWSRANFSVEMCDDAARAFLEENLVKAGESSISGNTEITLLALEDLLWELMKKADDPAKEFVRLALEKNDRFVLYSALKNAVLDRLLTLDRHHPDRVSTWDVYQRPDGEWDGKQVGKDLNSKMLPERPGKCPAFRDVSLVVQDGEQRRTTEVVMKATVLIWEYLQKHFPPGSEQRPFVRLVTRRKRELVDSNLSSQRIPVRMDFSPSDLDTVVVNWKIGREMPLEEHAAIVAEAMSKRRALRRNVVFPLATGPGNDPDLRELASMVLEKLGIVPSRLDFEELRHDPLDQESGIKALKAIVRAD